ncbi:DUF432 domain-containing protein [Prolixibacteraceae bacterium Z1-6]|uniref:DUF432 domain-containing protein n=1 Tax=Draconibacterium aestuarii TaxID=2998507 RepID=A0A9X3F7U3_9BACT|nr:DUF432 domain-containing protein [Prolixibacteraceae bacterium Z1-6]
MKKSFTWGKVALQKNSTNEFLINNIRLQFNSKNDVLAFKLVSPEEDMDEAAINRVVGKTSEITLLPALPDLPLVLKPKTNLSILPATIFKFYVYLPVTFQIYTGTVKSENKIYEQAIENLSSTWFGEPNEGELCYALYTSFDTEINNEKKGNEFVICPIEITNNSKETLEVKRLAVRGVHLNIYANNELMISNKVKIEYNGFETLSDIQFAKSATTSIPNLKQIATARIPETHTVLKRSFQLIRHITQY